MTGKIITIGIIGAGRMGSRWAQVISKNNNVKLSIVVDVNAEPGILLTKKYAGAYYKSLDTIPKTDIPDAFLVATTHRFLSIYARKVLEMKKHIFVEKPGARSALEIKNIILLAKKQKKVFMVGFNYRFFDAIQRAYKIIKKGDIGDLLSIRITHGHAGRLGYEKEWRMNKTAAGGGVLMDQGVHIIDLALWFMNSLGVGRIKFVSGVTSNKLLQTSVEDNAMIILKHQNGSIASLSVGVSEWKPVFVLEATGTKGSCRVDGVGKKYGGKELLTVIKRNKDNSTSIKEIECDSDADKSLNRELNEFIQAIQKGRPPEPSGVDAYNTLSIVDSIYKKHL